MSTSKSKIKLKLELTTVYRWPGYRIAEDKNGRRCLQHTQGPKWVDCERVHVGDLFKLLSLLEGTAVRHAYMEFGPLGLAGDVQSCGHPASLEVEEDGESYCLWCDDIHTEIAHADAWESEVRMRRKENTELRRMLLAEREGGEG